MEIYNGERGIGKTTHLIHISAYTHAPIIVFSFATKKLIIDTARVLGLDIPEPITFSEFKAGKLKGREKEFEKNGLLIDNVEFILGDVLSEYFSCPVLAATSSIPMKTQKNERGQV